MSIVDLSDVTKLALDLSTASARAIPQVEAVMKRGAQNVKTEMQDRFRGSPHFKGVAPGVSYDRLGFAGRIGFEIGPEIGRSGGSLGSIAVEGGANGGGGSVQVDDLGTMEAPNLERELGKVLGGLL